MADEERYTIYVEVTPSDIDASPIEILDAKASDIVRAIELANEAYAGPTVEEYGPSYGIGGFIRDEVTGTAWILEEHQGRDGVVLVDTE